MSENGALCCFDLHLKQMLNIFFCFAFSFLVLTYHLLHTTSSYFLISTHPIFSLF